MLMQLFRRCRYPKNYYMSAALASQKLAALKKGQNLKLKNQIEYSNLLSEYDERQIKKTVKHRKATAFFFFDCKMAETQQTQQKQKKLLHERGSSKLEGEPR